MTENRPTYYKNKNDQIVYLGLIFNEWSTGEGKNEKDGCSEVRIGVVDGKLNLANTKNGGNSFGYTPIEEDLATAIGKAINNPMKIEPSFNAHTNEVGSQFSRKFKSELSKKAKEYKRIATDTETLMSSGVKDLFQEIVDSGLVKSSEKAITIQRRAPTESGLHQPRLTLIPLSDYTPAIIVNNKNDSYKGKDVVCLRLKFNEWSTGEGENKKDGCSEVRIGVVDGRLSLANSQDGGKSVEYSPIEEDLKVAIHKAINEPMKIEPNYPAW